MQISELEKNIETIIKESQGNKSTKKTHQKIKKSTGTGKRNPRKNKKKDIAQNKKITQFYIKKDDSQEENPQPVVQKPLYLSLEEKDKKYYLINASDNKSGFMQREVSQIGKLFQAVNSQEKQILRQKSDFLSNLARAKVENIKEYHEIIRQERQIASYQKAYRGMKADQVKILPHNMMLNQTKMAINQKHQLLKLVQQKPEKHRHSLSEELFEEIYQLQKQQKQLINQQIYYLNHQYLARNQNESRFCREQWPLLAHRYQTVQLIGSGGYSSVYKAYDLIKDHYVAIKLCSVDEKSLIPAQVYMKHMRKECQVHLTLDHPNIIKLQEILEIDQTSLCLVLQLSHGQQLSKHLKIKQKMTQLQAKQIMFQIFQVIYYLSNRGQEFNGKKIVHYDLKPQNVLVENLLGKQHIKVIDFGLVKQIESDECKGETTSQGMGTFAYLPPQIYDVNSEFMLNNKIDIWSAGVIFYELLYGERPKLADILHGDIFKGESPSSEQQKMKAQTIFQEEHKNPGTSILSCNNNSIVEESSNSSENLLSCSNQTRQFIKRCLQSNPKDRLSPEQAYMSEYFSNFKKMHNFPSSIKLEKVQKQNKNNTLQQQNL